MSVSFEGFSQNTLDFLWNLRFNNEKSWFEAHREEYQAHLLRPIKALEQEVYDRLDAHFHIADKGLIHRLSRIHRDARRIRSGGPYRDHLWFGIEPSCAEGYPGLTFWFTLNPEDWSCGLGQYYTSPAAMKKLRVRIDTDPRAFEALIAPLEKQGEFVLDGPDYACKKEAPTAKTAPWYNKKSFSLLHSQTNGSELFLPDFAARLSSGFEFLMPFYEYFITLDSDPD